MNMNRIKRLLLVLLIPILLCSCAAPVQKDPAPAPQPQADAAEQPAPAAESAADEETPQPWLSAHSLALPEYEMSAASAANRTLAQAALEEYLNTPPIDFVYGGARFSEDRASWEQTLTETDSGKTVEYRHSQTGLCVTIDYSLFSDTSALEWTLRVRNDGGAASAVVEDFLTLTLERPTKGNTSLFYSKGGNAAEDDFLPVSASLKNGDSLWIGSNGGRSSSGVLPFFNLYTAKDKGCIGAIGWSGQWRVDVSKQDGTVSLAARMSDSRFYLEPGESVMLPSMILLPWENDAQQAHNDLRRHMILHNTPTDENGDVALGPVSFGVWGSDGEEEMISKLKAISNREMGYDVFWIDAGWHGDGSKISADTFDSLWFENAGTWSTIPSLYPNGMKPVSDFAHENGMGLLLWFEPERAFAGTELMQQHPDWFLTSPGNADNYLFDLGNDEARAWLCDYIAGLAREYGVDIFRNDFNIEPLDYWRNNDTDDRSGITEMKYIEGLYRFWDGLREACPGLIIDNCASGGRRLDFEAASRSVALFRSDYQCYTSSSTAEGCQCELYGLNFWFPVSGAASMGRTDAYTFRSNYGISIQTPNVISAYEEQIPLTEEFKSVRAYFYGDYYPLTDFPKDMQDGWFAYQLNRPEEKDGVVFAFRRIKSEQESVTVYLHGLDENAEYTVEVTDTGETYTMRGEELMHAGLTIAIDRKKDSRMLWYEMK